MTARSWKFHSGRMVLAIVFIALAGWLLGQTVLVLGAAAIVFLAWQLANIWRLRNWLKSPEIDVPESYGIWAE